LNQSILSFKRSLGSSGLTEVYHLVQDNCPLSAAVTTDLWKDSITLVATMPVRTTGIADSEAVSPVLRGN